jgi:hypothetical protein
MPLSDDPWILEHSVIDPERLHALGMITLFWNQCERNLWHLFCLVFDFHPRVGWIIAHDMGDVAICERIKEMLKIQPINENTKKLVLSVLASYDICRINRNTLTHFTVRPDEDGQFSFVRTKGPVPIQHLLPSSLEDVRSVAFEVKVLSHYIWDLYRGLHTFGSEKPTPLPPILEPPELLWKPPPKNE